MTVSYIQPTITPLPGGLTLTQFIQTVLVGISDLDGTLVRPKWQEEPPKQPTPDINWIAFGIDNSTPDANAYTGLDVDENDVMQRYELLEIGCSIYGPDSLEIAGIIRDGFQVQQNLEGLREANMGFVEVSLSRQIPDFVNERFINRVTMSIFLRREIQSTYPIVSIISASGFIHTAIGE